VKTVLDVLQHLYRYRAPECCCGPKWAASEHVCHRLHPGWAHCSATAKGSCPEGLRVLRLLSSGHGVYSFIQVSRSRGAAASQEIWTASGHVRHGLYPGRTHHATPSPAWVLRGWHTPSTTHAVVVFQFVCTSVMGCILVRAYHTAASPVRMLRGHCTPFLALSRYYCHLLATEQCASSSVMIMFPYIGKTALCRLIICKKQTPKWDHPQACAS